MSTDERAGDGVNQTPGGGSAGYGSDDYGSDLAGESVPRVEVLADADRPGAWMLLLERIRQSYVDLDDPTYLDFEYMRWMSKLIDAMAPGPLAVTHVGGGAATLVRYISRRRPGSTHIVLEPDAELTAFVRARLPFERDVRVRIRPVDGRSGLTALRDDSADLVVVDAFAGGRVPADLTTAECAESIARVLRTSGVALFNVGDGGRLEYTRRMVAALGTVLPERAVITEKGVFSGRRYGNVVVLASATPLPTEELAAGLAREPFPCQLRTGRELKRWLGSSRPFTDADSSRSPQPPEWSWRVSLD